jgi:hypothetical protein
MIRRQGLLPGAETVYGEPSAVWLTPKLATGRYFAMRPKDRQMWDQTADLSHELTLMLEQPVAREEDWGVVVVEARGLRIERFPVFASNFAHREPIGPERIVGTIDDLGVREVTAGLWRDPRVVNPH